MGTTRSTSLGEIVLINPTQRTISGGRDASKAIDGEEGTEYHSLEASSTEEWIKFDLQDPSIISTVTMIGRGGTYSTWGYRILGTQVRIYSEGSWTTCGTVNELRLSDPEYTITCPGEIIATKLWLYDDTVAVNGGSSDGGVTMIIEELTAFGRSMGWIDSQNIIQSDPDLPGPDLPEPRFTGLTVFDPDIPGTPIYRAKSFPPSIPVNRGPTVLGVFIFIFSKIKLLRYSRTPIYRDAWEKGLCTVNWGAVNRGPTVHINFIFLAMFSILLVLTTTGATASGELSKVVLINPTQRTISGGRDASRAIDGDLGTEYHSYYPATLTAEWIKFDLQDPSIISTVINSHYDRQVMHTIYYSERSYGNSHATVGKILACDWLKFRTPQSPPFRGDSNGVWGYRILGTQVMIYSEQQGSWTTCGTVDVHQSNPEYTITCPGDLVATKLWLYDNTVAMNGGSSDEGVIMIIKELTAFGAPTTKALELWVTGVIKGNVLVCVCVRLLVCIENVPCCSIPIYNNSDIQITLLSLIKLVYFKKLLNKKLFF
eukprot:sb/3463677/